MKDLFGQDIIEPKIHITKDWTGNPKGVFSVIGASNHSLTERVENDFYATPPSAVEQLSK